MKVMSREIDRSSTPHGKKRLILLDTGEFMVEEVNSFPFPARPSIYFEDEEEALRYWERELFHEYRRRTSSRVEAEKAVKVWLKKILDDAGFA